MPIDDSGMEKERFPSLDFEYNLQERYRGFWIRQAETRAGQGRLQLAACKL